MSKSANYKYNYLTVTLFILILVMFGFFLDMLSFTKKFDQFYNDHSLEIWFAIGCIFVVIALYFGWMLLKILIGQIFYTATKAIEEAKKEKKRNLNRTSVDTISKVHKGES